MGATKVLAYYLPQFHPIAENNLWWGEGFTEWTNVSKAKPFFKGHHQPNIPADLGFYDLRLSESREKQAELALQAGVSAFCYWHYWFGNGKTLLEGPLQGVLETKKPDFPFCLAWANHTWYKKHWNSDVSRLSKELLIEQQYPGRHDFDNHFNYLLPAFSDPRYFKINGKLVFVLYNLDEIPDFEFFISRWQELAVINGFKGFHFIGHTASIGSLTLTKYQIIDGINLHIFHKCFNESRAKTKINTLKSLIYRKPTRVIDYSDAMSFWIDKSFKTKNVYPTIYPNWDNTPRFGTSASVLINSNPESFKRHVSQVLDLISHKEDNDRIVFLKSWNEWAEGNYMEPDLKYGKGFIKALSEALEDSDRKK